MQLLLALAVLVQQPDTVRLPDVVATASRVAARDVATFSTTVISHADLVERGDVQLLDALRRVPGVTVVQAGSRGAQASIFLRGGESDFVKFLVDGVAVNSAGGWFNVANLGTANIDRIEIVRGPGSVLHGSDAMAGTIQVYTRRGAGALRPTVQLEMGGQQSRLVAAGLSGAGQAGSLAIEASRYRTEGSYPFNAGYRHDELSGRLATATTGSWQAAATLRAGSSRAEFPTDGNGDLVDRNQYTTEQQLVAGLELSHRLPGGLTLQALGSVSRTEEGFRDARDAAADTVGYGFTGLSDGRGVRSGVDLRLLGIQVGPVAGVVGLQYEDERHRRTASTTSNFGFGVITEDEAFRASRSTRAAYGEGALTPVPAITISAAARLDDNSAFGSQGSWRLGATARAHPALAFHVVAGRAFKAPTFSELLARSPFEIGNPDLQPESAVSWEAGTRATLLDGRLHLGLNGFHQRFSNLIQYAGAGPGEPTYANVGAATSRGLELTIDLMVSRTISLSVSGTRLATRVVRNGGSGSVALTEGRPLVRRPDWSGAASVRWAPTGSASVQLGVGVVGPRDDVDFREFPATRVRLGGRAITDLAITTDLPGIANRVGAVLRVENLLDTRWEQTLGFPGRGRLVHLGLRTGR